MFSGTIVAIVIVTLLAVGVTYGVVEDYLGNLAIYIAGYSGIAILAAGIGYDVVTMLCTATANAAALVTTMPLF